jgi:hypothetical protein
VHSSISVGDIVSHIDEDLCGQVISVSSYKACILCTDGFEHEFSLAKLVKVSDIDTPIIYKDIAVSKLPVTWVQIDLHDEKIPKTYKTSVHVLENQLNFLHQEIQRLRKVSSKQIEIIYGRGQGILRDKVIEYLSRHQIRFDKPSLDMPSTKVYL